MHTPLVQKNPRRYAGPEAMVYAHEIDATSLGHLMASSLTRATSYLMRDNSADGSFRLAVNDCPSSLLRAEMKPDGIMR